MKHRCGTNQAESELINGGYTVIMYYDKCGHPEMVTLPVNIFEYRFSYDVNKDCCFHPHNHIQVEILYIVDGETEVSIDDKPYALEKGDLVLFNPFEIHAGHMSQPHSKCVLLCLALSASYFDFFKKSVLSRTAEQINTLAYRFDNFYPHDTEDAPELGACMIGMHECFDKKAPGFECGMLAHFHRLMQILFDKHYQKIVGCGNRNIDFIRDVQKIINEKYNEPLTTSDVSGALYMMSSRFCQLFRENFACSFLTYLSGYRIRKAKEYVNSTMTIAEIASAVGFSDYCHFSRSFHKQVGVSPSVFFGRRRNKS